MRRLIVAAAWAVACLLSSMTSNPAAAEVVVNISKSSQRMAVVVDGSIRYTWAVSTARSGFITPSGSYRPSMLARRWYSSRYHNSPMPHSIFFHKGYAIHGSYETARLGSPASHGCIRLLPANAATLFSLVQSHGSARTRIVVAN
jgi:lipoprotein-anchoring transpeptidase ErfK/SrfK